MTADAIGGLIDEPPTNPTNNKAADGIRGLVGGVPGSRSDPAIVHDVFASPLCANVAIRATPPPTPPEVGNSFFGNALFLS